jgi:glutamate--cysteine ligase catalytic subunit
MDSTAAGWGCCCLQVTFQAESFKESLYLYDQLLPLCPIMVNFIFSLQVLKSKYIYLNSYV